MDSILEESSYLPIRIKIMDCIDNSRSMAGKKTIGVLNLH